MSKNKNTAATAQKQATQQDFLFDKSNYILMLAGVVLVVIGFMLMSGGKSEDPNKFNYDEIYSTTRITIAPLMILIGFAIEIYAIMKKPAAKNSEI
jgi:predicted tellurium resistance membrane protein TerC